MAEEQDKLGAAGRPRSQQARQAVLHAVDDLLVEMGYAAMTMKNIAERAQVSRQTVYRWWSTKAEILFEACAEDAAEELKIVPSGDALTDISAYLGALIQFLSASPSGAAYRALVGEAQHSKEVAALLARSDILGASAVKVLETLPDTPGRKVAPERAARLIAPVFYWIVSGREPRALSATALARRFLSEPPTE